MKKFTTFKLYFKGPLHISPKGARQLSDIENFIHSDTLATAMAYALSLVGYDTCKIKKFLDELEISSAFPFVEIIKEENDSNNNEEDPETYFLPLPKGIRLSKNPESKVRKKVKKIQWLSADLWNKVIAGNLPEIDKNILDEISSGAFMFSNTEVKKVLKKTFRKTTRMRVKVPRVPGDAAPYEIAELHFFNGKDNKNQEIHNSGLYFILKNQNKINEVKAALEILQDMGIGADRTVGYGYFTYKTGTIELNEPEECNAITNLSLYLPASEKEFNCLELINYSLILRSGWVTVDEYRGHRKNGVYMFQEGSVFRGATPTGTVINVTPKKADGKNEKIEIPIYRYGKGFFVKIKYNEDGSKQSTSKN